MEGGGREGDRERGGRFRKERNGQVNCRTGSVQVGPEGKTSHLQLRLGLEGEVSRQRSTVS